MTEPEIMRHAKSYIDKLANGIDPITDREAPEGDIIHNARLSRCFSYVSGVLQQVIDNGGAVSGGDGMRPFALSPKERERYPFINWPVGVGVIAQRLNDLVDPDSMKKLKATSITAFLLQSGLLEESETSAGRKHRLPTEAGRSLGITTEQRTGQNGEYTAVLYSPEAQRFILDNLDAIMAINAAPLHENQGKPWAPEEDVWLEQAFRAGTEVKEMSAALGRSRAGIRSRLKRLGLTEE